MGRRLATTCFESVLAVLDRWMMMMGSSFSIFDDDDDNDDGVDDDGDDDDDVDGMKSSL